VAVADADVAHDEALRRSGPVRRLYLDVATAVEHHLIEGELPLSAVVHRVERSSDRMRG
jgi:hypothetical protein